MYLTLYESFITYGIIGVGRAYDNSFSQIQKCKITITRVANKTDRRYPTKKLFGDPNVFNMNQLHQKAIIIYLKKHKLLSTI